MTLVRKFRAKLIHPRTDLLKRTEMLKIILNSEKYTKERFLGDL